MEQEGVKNAQLVQGDNHKEISLQQGARFKLPAQETIHQLSVIKKPGIFPVFLRDEKKYYCFGKAGLAFTSSICNVCLSLCPESSSNN